MIKKIKRILLIISIPSTIMSMVFFATGIVAMGSELGIIDIDSLNLSMSGNRTVNSQGVQAILDWAKVIAEYMDQYDFEYRLYNLTTRYNEQSTGGGTCCTTYVSWVLQEAGYLEDSEHTNYHWSLKKLLDTKSEWQYMKVTSESELQAGDIVIYEGYENSGKHVQHSNICAGYNEDNKMVYWDAGDGSNGAFKGTTKTHWMQGYNCSYRLVK